MSTFMNTSLLYLFCIFQLSDFVSQAHASATSCNCTEHVPQHISFRETVLTRRTRSFLFPKKAFLLLSPAFTKAVLDGRPRGLSYSIEFDMYSPLPDTIAGWQPTIVFNQIKQKKEYELYEEKKAAAAAAALATPPPAATSLDAGTVNVADTATTAPTGLMDTVDDNVPPHFFDDNIWSDERYQFPIEGPADYPDDYLLSGSINRRLDQTPWYAQHDFGGRKELKDFYERNFPKTYNNHTNVTPQYETIKRFHQIPKLKKYINEKKSKHTKSSKKKSKNSSHKRKYNYYDKWSSYGPPEEVYYSREEVPEWKYHQGYRERREIFEQLEAVGKIFNFNMKACIQRAMCEITTHLRPYGESLMEDVVRIILTIPNDHNFNDDYTHAAHKMRNVNCMQHFATTCPYRIMEILTKSMRNINLTEAV